jgi:hypothetical protein
MEPKLRKTYVNLISQTISWFNRLRETNVWAAFTRDEQTKCTERERNNHDIFLFLTVLLLFAQCKMHYWWLVTWLDKKSFVLSSLSQLRIRLETFFVAAHYYFQQSKACCTQDAIWRRVVTKNIILGNASSHAHGLRFPFSPAFHVEKCRGLTKMPPSK